MSAVSERFATASCEGKKKYETFTQAKRGVTGFKFQKGLGSAMQPYSCSFCGKFHVGHAAPREKRKPAFLRTPRKDDDE